MASPPKMKIPAYGLSRSTGGVIGGKAHGNTFNMGDANAVWEDMDVFSDHPAEKTVHGKIRAYVSDLNPSEINLSQSSFVTKVYDINKCQTIQDIVRRSSEDYSPIHRKLFYIKQKTYWRAWEEGYSIFGGKL